VSGGLQPQVTEAQGKVSGQKFNQGLRRTHEAEIFILEVQQPGAARDSSLLHDEVAFEGTIRSFNIDVDISFGLLQDGLQVF
jgi:hypothetical protein